jgi:hypothetical protein
VKPVIPTELPGSDEYEAIRPVFRRRVMRLRDLRRVALGEEMTVHFETRDTVVYQILEMLRAEGGWHRPGGVASEVEAYNPLVPAGSELSATLMVETDAAGDRDRLLRDLVDLDGHLFLQSGGLPSVAARFDRAQIGTDRISAVQYLKWPVDAANAAALRTPGTAIRVICDHPSYRAQAVLTEDTRSEIAADLD